MIKLFYFPVDFIRFCGALSDNNFAVLSTHSMTVILPRNLLRTELLNCFTVGILDYQKKEKYQKHTKC